MARRRRRGDGSVFYDHAERVWVARVSLGQRNGKRIRHKVRARTEADAWAELDRLRKAYAAGGDPTTETLDVYLVKWLAHHGTTVRPSTRAAYAGHIRNHISPLLGGIPVAKLRASDVRRLIAESLDRVSPATTGRIVTTLHIALQALVDERSLTDNPARVRLPKVDRQPVHAMTFAEAEAIIDATRETWIGRLVRFLVGSGLRLGEATGLDQGDLMLDSGYVRLRVSKTTTRAVPVSQDGLAALREALVEGPRRGAREPVFFGPRGADRNRAQRGRLRGSSVSHAMPRILEAAGLGHLAPHALRHGHATMLLSQGVPMRVIAEQLGHANPAMTARVYAHVIPESQAAAVSVLDSIGSRNGSRLA